MSHESFAPAVAAPQAAPADVLRSDVLSDLYGANVFVLRAGDRLVVVGAPDAEASHHHHDHEEHS